MPHQSVFKKDKEGYLLNFNDWNQFWVEQVLQSHPLKVRFSFLHSKMIMIIRQIFKEINRVPSQRIFFKALKKDPEFFSFDSFEFYKVFSSDQTPMQQLCLLAGLPPPTHCI